MPLSSIASRFPGTTPASDAIRRINATTNLYDTGGQPGGSVGAVPTAISRLRSAIGGASGTGGLPRAAAAKAVMPTTQNPYVNKTATSGVSGALNAASQSPAGAVGAAVANAPGTFTTGTANNGTEPMRGWAASMGYTPADIMGMNQMPSRYLSDILEKRGMDPTGGLYYMMEPLADAMMPLFEMIYGGSRPAGKPFELNDIANFMGQMFGESMTPGGRLPDSSELMNHLFGGGNSGSQMDLILNKGTPEEQINNMQKYAMLVAQLSGSPMSQQAMSNLISSQGMNYLNDFIGGQEPSRNFGYYVQNPNF
jgi:hypothetical protein